MKITVFITLVLALAAMSTSVLAEVIGPVLPPGVMQVGAQQQWVKRDMYYGDIEQETNHNEFFGALRWGITEVATISLEGSFGANPDVGSGVETEYYYLVGGGAQATLWKHPRAIVTGGYQFTASLYRVSGDGGNISTESHNAQLMVQTDAGLWSQRLTAWAGPAFSKHYITNEKTLVRDTRTYYTNSDWGGVIGFDLLLWSHVDLTSCLLWVENPQPRVALYYRF